MITMCAVNDKKREAVRLRINGYKTKKSELEEFRTKIEKAFYENIEALTYITCVTNNLSGIDLGGPKTIDSLNECKKSIKERKDFFEEQLKNAVSSIKKIENAIEAAEKEYNNIPENCGACLECCPSEQGEKD